MGKIYQGPKHLMDQKVGHEPRSESIVYVDRIVEVPGPRVEVPGLTQIVYVDRPVEVIKEVMVPEYHIVEVTEQLPPEIQIKEVIKEIEVPSAPHLIIKKVYPIWLLVASGLNLLLTVYLLIK